MTGNNETVPVNPELAFQDGRMGIYQRIGDGAIFFGGKPIEIDPDLAKELTEIE